jgi:hypothetical protein
MNKADRTHFRNDNKKISALNVTEIPLSNWKRSLCECIEYPAFSDQEPVKLPDLLTERMSCISGFVCYETIFMLHTLKSLTLEISNAIGSVEVFINGETLGIQAKPPCHYDLSSLAWEGKNYLAIEVAIGIDRKRLDVEQNQPCIIGNVRLFNKKTDAS